MREESCVAECLAASTSVPRPTPHVGGVSWQAIEWESNVNVELFLLQLLTDATKSSPELREWAYSCSGSRRPWDRRGGRSEVLNGIYRCWNPSQDVIGIVAASTNVSGCAWGMRSIESIVRAVP